MHRDQTQEDSECLQEILQWLWLWWREAFNDYDEEKSQIYFDQVQHVYDQLECDVHCHHVKFQSHKQAEE